MKKKIVIILGSIISLLIIILVVIPYFFKDEIKDEILRNINRNIDGEVIIEDYDLSLIQNFPRFTFSFEGVKMLDDDKNQILDIKRLSAEIDSKDLIVDRSITINSISVIQPMINYKLSSDSVSSSTKTDVNNDFENISESLDEEKIGDNNPKLSLNISNYEIVGASVKIIDEKDNDFIIITNLNHNGYGVFEDDVLSLNTMTFIDDIDISQDKKALLKNAQFKGELKLDLDFTNKIYSLKENSLSINSIDLNWVGVIKEIDNNIDIDLRFDTPNTKFKDLLELVPEQFKKDFDKLDTKGEFKIEGAILGVYNENTLPSFDIKTAITNAYIKYPELPESINDINLLVNINKPQGNDLDKISVTIPSASVKVSDNSIRGSMYATNLVSDPHFQAKFLANFDLAKVRNAIPLEKGDDINGKIFADVSLKGKLSDLENENYDKFEAKGDITLNNFNFTTKALNNKVFINNANMEVSPEYLYLKTFDFKIGKSDIKAKGKVSKYIEYFLEDKQLKGWLDIKSNNFYAADFIPKTTVENGNSESKSDKEDEPFKMDVINIPENISFDNNISINSFKYGNIKATNVEGHLGIKNQNAYLQKVKMNMFNGRVKMDGNYSSIDSLFPKTDFNLELQNIDIQRLSKTFKFVKQIAPIVKSASGKISAKIDLKTTLDKTMNPVYETMYSKGNIKTRGLSLKNTDFLNSLGDVLNVNELKKDPKIEDTNINYTIEKGILTMSPFKLKIADIETKMGGSSNIGKQTIDMDVAMVFPRKYLNDDTNEIIDGAVNMANSFGANVSMGETIDVNAKIDGKISSPKYSLTYGPDKSKTPEEYLKKEADKLIEEAKKDAGKDLEKKANDFLNDLFK